LKVPALEELALDAGSGEDIFSSFQHRHPCRKGEVTGVVQHRIQMATERITVRINYLAL
jgi:hypothetical protein